MWGVEAAKTSNNLGGQTVYRTGVTVTDGLVDLHIRVADVILAQGHFDETYLHALGGELSGLGRDVYVEFIDRLKSELARVQPEHPFGSCPTYGDDTMCPGIMNGIRPTLLYSVVRNYMCKSHNNDMYHSS